MDTDEVNQDASGQEDLSSCKKSHTQQEEIMHSFNYESEENFGGKANLSQNERFLQKKREAESSTPFGQSGIRISNEQLAQESRSKSEKICSLCKIGESASNSTIKSCKMCQANFHLDCLLSIGECQFGENFMCIKCKRDLNINNAFNRNYDFNQVPFINERIPNNFNNQGKPTDLRADENTAQNNPMNFNNMVNLEIIKTYLKNSQVNPMGQLASNMSQMGQMGGNMKMNNFEVNKSRSNFLPQGPGQAPLNQLIANYINKQENKQAMQMAPNDIILQQLLFNSAQTGQKGANMNTNMNRFLSGQNKQNEPNQIPNANPNQIPNANPNNPLFSQHFINQMNKYNNNVMNFHFVNNFLHCSNLQSLANTNIPEGKSSTNNKHSNPHQHQNQSHNISSNPQKNQKQQPIGNLFPTFMSGNVNANNSQKLNFNNSTTNTNSNNNINSTNTNLNFAQQFVPNSFYQNMVNITNQNSSSKKVNSNIMNINPNPNSNLNIQTTVTEQVKKYPIEDSLLFKNPDLYEVDIEFFERPEFSQVGIAKNLVNKVFSIWDFIATFKSPLGDENITKEIKDIETFYQNLQEDSFFQKIVITFLPLFTLTISVMELTEFSEDKELLLIRTLKENINTDISTIYQRCCYELIRIILDSKKFSLLVDKELKLISERIKNEADCRLNLEDKIKILFYLTNSALDNFKVREIIHFEINKKHELIREKSILEAEYRAKEIRKREIEKSERFHNAANKIEMLTKKLEDLEQKNETLQQGIYLKQKKEIEIERERHRSIVTENEQIQITKEKIVERLKDIKNELVNMNITSKRMIGLDLFKNEYYYFEGIQNKIYMKKIEENSKAHTWMYCDNQEDLQELVNRLLDKGLREKKLKRNLSKILSKKMNFEIKKEDEMQIEETDKNDKIDKNEHIQQIEDNFTDNNNHENVLMPAVEILQKLDDKFSEYLIQYNKEWEVPSVRTKWREIINKTFSLSNCSESLRMLNQRFKIPYRSDEPPISEDDEAQYQNSPKFIFTSEFSNEDMFIHEFDPTKITAPKVKIWSKDLEINEMDKFYTDFILPHLTSIAKFYLALHFYESIIFSLIKRREGVSNKKNLQVKESNEKEPVSPLNNMEVEEIKADEIILPEDPINEINEDAIDEKTVSYSPDEKLDVDKTESVINLSNNNSDKKSSKKKETPKSSLGNLCNVLSGNIGRRKRNAVPKDQVRKDWRETCYVCGEYGELVCCDGCVNVAHKFCVCLEKVPEEWFCEKCREKTIKSKKTKKCNK